MFLEDLGSRGISVIDPTMRHSLSADALKTAHLEVNLGGLFPQACLKLPELKFREERVEELSLMGCHGPGCHSLAGWDLVS